MLDSIRTASSSRRSFKFVLVALLATGLAQDLAEAGTAERLEFFETRVRPLLAERCYSCHGAEAESPKAGLFVDSLGGLLDGGDSGPAVVPGDPDGSLLIEAVRYESYEMPPSGKLPDEEIAVLEQWIRDGAAWPDEAEPSRRGAAEEFDLEARAREHWAWRPVTDPAPPKVRDAEWPESDLDRFILAELEREGLRPADDADGLALLRRVHFDLTGLPPTAAEVASMSDAQSHEQIERVVDALLDSPEFGERWARRWLDLMRYAESRGHEFDDDIPNAFQYRDYVIRALNADVPYDHFVREHIAGDLLAAPRLHPTEGFNESVLGTGFWFLGEWVHSPVDIRKEESERFANMIDVMSKAFLGVTVACARCHDHKFDAISTEDYYTLTGFLQSSDYRQVRFASIERNREVARRLAEIDRGRQEELTELLAEAGIEAPEPPRALGNPAVVVNYGGLPDSDFMQDGYLFGQWPRRAGALYLRPGEGGAAIATHAVACSDHFWRGVVSTTSGDVQNKSELVKLPKSGRTLRTPTFELRDGRVSCLVEGVGHVIACVDSHRLLHGPLHHQTLVEVSPDRRWTKLDLGRYVGHRLHLEFVPAEDEALSVRLVAQGLDDEGLARLERELADIDHEYVRYATTAEPVLASDAGRRIVEAWKHERSSLRSQILFESPLAPAMVDGTGEEGRVLIRGNASKPGDAAPRRFLAAIAGDAPMTIPSGSGRMQLADAIVDPANPLTSRVVVNRLWGWLMGRGVAPTPDDFGVLGQRPTHPELLDHLASRFDADGRSLKRMIRYIVLSRSYRMASRTDPTAGESDPGNRLWHHRPPKRLEGEAIRDALLALSGGLDATRFGPSVPVHLTAFMDGRGRPEASGPADGDGRRSIYLAVRRNFLSPLMLAFDTPPPFSTMGRRTVSNVPAQALILMNNPFVREQSRGWAERALGETGGREERIDWMYRTAFARLPTDAERAIAADFVGDATSLDRWADLAHALVNTKEFIFLR